MTSARAERIVVTVKRMLGENDEWGEGKMGDGGREEKEEVISRQDAKAAHTWPVECQHHP